VLDGFETGKEDVPAKYKSFLEALRKKLIASKATVVLIGHTDTTGPEKLNRDLGLLRAAAVRDILIKGGQLDPDSINIQSKGATQPLAGPPKAKGGKGESNPKNRRVEIRIGPPAKAPEQTSGAGHPDAAIHKAEITIENATDGTLLLTQESLSELSTDSLIPNTIPATHKASLTVYLQDLTSSALLYAVVPAGVTAPPKDAPTWQVQWLIQPDGKLAAPAYLNDAPSLASDAKTDGVGKISFKLSGKVPAAAQAIGISITNDTDRKLRFIKADSDGGRFDPGAFLNLYSAGRGSLRATPHFLKLP